MTSSSRGSGWILLRHDPRRLRLRRLTLVALWLASLYAAGELARRAWPVQADGAPEELRRLRVVVAESQAQLERLATRLRRAERGEDVARGAIARLQGLLGEQQAEIARLRADLAFFERLTAPEGERRGMAIHGLTLRPGESGGYLVRFAMAQNLETARAVRGHVWLEAEGMLGDRRRRLGWAELRGDPAARPLPYAFRYFQQFEEDIVLPPQFRPLRLVVRWLPEGGREAEESYVWEDIVQSREANHVRK